VNVGGAGLAVTLYSLLEMSRRRVLFVLLVVGLVLIIGVGLAPLVIPNMAPGEERNLFLLQQLSGLVGSFSGLVALAIGMTVVYHDLDSGAAIALFAKPVGRLAYALGKLAAGFAALVGVIVVLALGARTILSLNGGGHEAVLWLHWATLVANLLLLLVFVAILSTFMNNVVAAIIGFVGSQVMNVVVALHAFVAAHLIHNPLFSVPIEIVYWIVPHLLNSGLAREIIETSLRLRPPPLGAPGTAAILASVAGPSGAGDVLYWAVYLLALCAVFYWAVRRRQV